MEEAEMPDTRGFRNLMGLFPTGVTIVTVWGDEGPLGMTGNALASLSLEPMLIMVGFDLKSRTLKAVERFGRFGVNFLSKDQEEESRRFASKMPESEKFEGVPYEISFGVPILHGTTGWLVCETDALHPAGDHVIAVGRLLAMGRNPAEPEPLVFYRGHYASLNGQ